MRHHAPLTTDCIDPKNAIEKPPKIEGQPSGSSFKTASNPPLGVGLSPPVDTTSCVPTSCRSRWVIPVSTIRPGSGE
jgi:hypothetical protein